MSAELDGIAGEVKAYNALGDQIAALKRTRDNLKAKIEETLAGEMTGTIDGEVVVEIKIEKRNALSQKLLKSLHPEVLEECRETTEVRKFTTKEVAP